jgi:hypothetical protein
MMKICTLALAIAACWSLVTLACFCSLLLLQKTLLLVIYYLEQRSEEV